MRWSDLFVALGLVMIIEGILPFVSPEKSRVAARVTESLSNFRLRLFGFIALAGGALLIYIAGY
ncbi:MAG: DUF2065 domain-containing protein [Gammaproteobacteria bacterium]|nr:DUF2065 domain-containing protein [Gammaproteobacteria bacterium]MDD9808128.1 DUF2065 domain-containing protein [Gammaproteobacteria bacterium]MDD9868907.1 DUF2065 domain-containing protein [Gammaproteobacteria bacterium]MDD9885631.1 DUF2065 domain-containing protein [Gammaproteobacteria bacterium]